MTKPLVYRSVNRDSRAGAWGDLSTGDAQVQHGGAMAQGQHDTIAYRLSQILFKLNQGEKLQPEALAQEFGVHLRTIQRDLKVRLAYLPLLKQQGKYQLEPAFLGKLSFKDIERFAGLAGVKGLFPSLSTEFLRSIFDDRMQAAFLIKSHHYEDLSGHQEMFSLLEEAIITARLVAFDMIGEGAAKGYEAVAPYRLLNSKGIWYLAAVHQGKYKTFGLAKLQRVKLSSETFARQSDVAQAIEEQEGIWQSEANQKVVLVVGAPVARYFKRRQLVPHQEITGETLGGELTVTTRVGHQTQILPIVRYWIPHVRILSPQSWQMDLDRGLAAYLYPDGDLSVTQADVGRDLEMDTKND